MNTLSSSVPVSGTYHQFARLQSLSEWWHWVLLIAIVLGIAGYVVWMYRRDAIELRRGLAWMLLALRLAAFLGILFYFFDLERRTERRIVKDSRLHLVVDTSQSMGLPDQPTTGGSGPSRAEKVINEFTNSDLLADLRRDHQLVVSRFDQQQRPVEIATFAKLSKRDGEDAETAAEAARRQQVSMARWAAVFAGVLAAIAVVGAGLAWSGVGRSATSDTGSWLWLVAAVGGIAAAVVLAVATLRTPGFNIQVTLGLKDDVAPRATTTRGAAGGAENEKPPPEPSDIDWRAELSPRGTETRLGDIVEFLANKERGGPIAGVVVYTDGGRNAGQPMEAALEAAQNAGIPVYAVGLGSDKRPLNLRVVDLEAPARVYPGDKFTLTGILQGFGTAGRTAKVELLESTGASDSDAPGVKIDERSVQLGPDGELTTVKFEATPEEPGQVTYRLRATLGSADTDPKDDERQVRVQVVERKNRVLLIAGGPSREYQFLKNLLYRDRDTTVDVWLQSGTEGMSQEANEVLFDFPSVADELFEYDCIVGFDPDWEKLDADQAKLLERWIAEEGGGLLVVAGPVFTPLWSSRRPGDEVADLIKALYPVAFYYQGAATLSLGRFGGDKPWQLEFSRDGLDAEFLWLGEDSTSSEQAWTSFDGVFGYYAVKDPKPAARVYSRFSDPDTSLDGDLPIYMAGQIYGSGRVFFQASGEMWRLRAVDDNYFDQYYTKLIRWVSQGRLSRDSRRGVLLVDKDRALIGDQIAVRAMLKNAQFQPLDDPEVSAVLVAPDGKRTPLKLRPLADGKSPDKAGGKKSDGTGPVGRAGMYAGEFSATQEGDYRLELRPPESDPDELLSKEVRVRVPALEIERPERNDPVLRELADKTGGAYFVGVDAAMNRSGGGTSLAMLIEPQDQTTYLPGTPDRDFERQLMGWLMGLICGVLSIEWLVRRLSKLA